MKDLSREDIGKLQEMAEQFTAQKINLPILIPGKDYPFIVHAIEQYLIGLEKRKTLLLPELGFDNNSVAAFSDYSGDSASSKYLTYTFLVCAWNQTGFFLDMMEEIRRENGLESKEIEFKDLHYGPIKRALDVYLGALNFVPGLLFTIAIEKQALYRMANKEETTHILQLLEENGCGEWEPQVIDKLLFLCHAAAYLVTLLAKAGQKISWMSDHDNIVANENRKKHWLRIFGNCLSYYADRDYPLVGGAVPFRERSLMMLDLLSATDLTAGAIEHHLTRKAKGKERDRKDVEVILKWLSHDGIGLKKISILIRVGPEGEVQSCGLEFIQTKIDEGKFIIPLIRP
jgi:hypothetical protein